MSIQLNCLENLKDKKLLLHVCCAPCSVEVIKRLAENNIDVTVLFYNPNIHPQKEYILRKDENKEVCDFYGVKFVDLDYDADGWFEYVRGLENCPEQGKRCTKCFEYRLAKTAMYALKNGFDIISSTLDASRWKSKEQVAKVAKEIEKRYDIKYNYIELRKGGTQTERLRLVKEHKLYNQNYCGCIYSKRNNE